MVSSTTIRANHIVGGEISYEFVGFRGGRVGSDTLRYRVVLLLVRDCNGGAAFDRTVPIAIYQGNNTRPLRNLRISRPLITKVSPDQSNPCLIVPPGFCEEEAIYSDTIELIRSNQPYILTYQICCRNTNIANIIDSKNTGITLTVEITPQAQSLNNSSPRFTAPIKSELCVGVSSALALQVNDKDGDRLVYSFCAPLVGGGPLGGGVNDAHLASTAQGIKPDPAAPGPYDEVPYALNFSPARPLGNTGAISLDSTTGIIRVLARTLGQYSLGICVKEYRNGVLIGMIRRDIQLKVSNCNFAIDARVQADSSNNQGNFWLRSCNRPNFAFTNTSIGDDKIFAYRWSFTINGRTETRDTKNASFDFGNPGTYNGLLVLNPGTVCTDTAKIEVRVFPSARAQFSATLPGCELGPVVFTNQSTLNAGATFRSVEWNFGDNARSDQVAPQHQYSRAGTYPVSLVILTNTGCRDTARQRIDYFPVPASAIRLQAQPNEACAQTGPINLSLNVPTALNHPGYLVEWDFGDGSKATGFSTQKTYPNPGQYTVAYRITAPGGCNAQGDNATQPLRVVERPVADFSFTPEEPNARAPEVTFSDNSSLANTWSWDFGGKGKATVPNPTFSFPIEGTYNIKLVVGNGAICRDSIVKSLKVKAVEAMYIPNAFSPTGKAANAVFKPLGLLPGLEAYDFRVYNRWGQLLFQTNDPGQGWNGQVQNQGERCMQDTYLFQLVFRSAAGKMINKQGSILLLW